MSGELGEKIARRMLMEEVVVTRFISWGRCPMFVFGITPRLPFGLAFVFGWWALSIGPHYVLVRRRAR